MWSPSQVNSECLKQRGSLQGWSQLRTSPGRLPSWANIQIELTLIKTDEGIVFKTIFWTSFNFVFNFYWFLTLSQLRKHPQRMILKTVGKWWYFWQPTTTVSTVETFAIGLTLCRTPSKHLTGLDLPHSPVSRCFEENCHNKQNTNNLHCSRRTEV